MVYDLRQAEGKLVGEPRSGRNVQYVLVLLLLRPQSWLASLIPILKGVKTLRITELGLATAAAAAPHGGGDGAARASIHMH